MSFLKLHDSPFVEAQIRLACNLIILGFAVTGDPRKYLFFPVTGVLNFLYKKTSSGRSAFRGVVKTLVSKELKP